MNRVTSSVPARRGHVQCLRGFFGVRCSTGPATRCIRPTYLNPVCRGGAVGAFWGPVCRALGDHQSKRLGARIQNRRMGETTLQGNDGLRQEKRLGDALDEQYLYSLISFTAATLQLSNEHVPGLVLQHLRVGKQSSLLSSIGVPLGQGETVPTSEAASFLLAVHQSRSSAAFWAHRHHAYRVRRE